MMTNEQRQRMLTDPVPAGLICPLFRWEALGDRSPWRLGQELSPPPRAAAAPLPQEETTWNVKAVWSPLQTPRSPWKSRGWKGEFIRSQQSLTTSVWGFAWYLPLVRMAQCGGVGVWVRFATVAVAIVRRRRSHCRRTRSSWWWEKTTQQSEAASQYRLRSEVIFQNNKILYTSMVTDRGKSSHLRCLHSC